MLADVKKYSIMFMAMRVTVVLYIKLLLKKISLIGTRGWASPVHRLPSRCRFNILVIPTLTCSSGIDPNVILNLHQTYDIGDKHLNGSLHHHGALWNDPPTFDLSFKKID